MIDNARSDTLIHPVDTLDKIQQLGQSVLTVDYTFTSGRG